MQSSDIYDVINQGFNVVMSSVGVVANLLLLFAIRKRRTRSIQTFSILLMQSTVVDLIATNCFTPRQLDNLHYLHWTLQYLWNDNLQAARVLLISLLIHLSNGSIAFAVFSLFSDNCSDMAEFVGLYPQYKGMIDTRFTLGAVHFSSVKSFLTAMFLVISSPVVFSIAFFLRSRTVRALEKTAVIMSSSTKELHRMFVRTLNFQLALTTFVGIGGGVYIFNLMGWTTNPLSEIAPCAIANLLPSIAPTINLWCIRPYREFTKRALSQWIYPYKVTLIGSTTTTSSQNTTHQLIRHEVSRF